MSAIDAAQIEHVARLARLRISPDELGRLTAECDRILDYMAKLSELDTADVPPTSHPLARADVFRDDEPHEPLGAERVLSLAPEKEEGHLKVPKVLDHREA